MSEMLDRMVGAFSAAIPADANENILSHELRDGMRAVLEAMRDATPQMIEAGRIVSGEPIQEATETWHAMIDEALK